MNAPTLRLALLVSSGVLALAGCADPSSDPPRPADPEDSPMATATTPLPTAPLPTTASSGARLCDFVPRASVEALVGDDLEHDGQVDRDNAGHVTGALCLAKPAGAAAATVRVQVGFNQGFGRQDFDRGLQDASYTQLAADRGLGFTYQESDAGHARLAQGDFLVQVDVGAVRGRDAEEDAAALAQQVVGTLELPSRWTLDGEPAPSR